MARTAAETANVLSDLYDENFGHNCSDPFRITWPQLRSLAGVPRLEKTFLKAISEVLSEDDYSLIPFNDFLFFTAAVDLLHFRIVPDRLLEQNLPNPEDVEIDDDEDEDEDCDEKEPNKDADENEDIEV